MAGEFVEKTRSILARVDEQSSGGVVARRRTFVKGLLGLLAVPVICRDSNARNPNTCPTTLTVRRVADTTIVVPSDTSTSSTTLPGTSTSTCFEGGPFEAHQESVWVTLDS